jgi:muramidase (phage lysozyme)
MKQFSSFAEHPFAGREARSTASGAYGTLVKTWHDYLPFLALPERGDRFTPTIQDRIAITIMEQTSNALGLVRRGEIVAAADILGRRKQFASMPSGSQSRGFDNSELMASYEEFLSKLRQGK